MTGADELPVGATAMAAMLAGVHDDPAAVEGHVTQIPEEGLREALVALAVGCGAMVRAWCDEEGDARWVARVARVARLYVVDELLPGEKE